MTVRLKGVVVVAVAALSVVLTLTLAVLAPAAVPADAVTPGEMSLAEARSYFGKQHDKLGRAQAGVWITIWHGQQNVTAEDWRGRKEEIDKALRTLSATDYKFAQALLYPPRGKAWPAKVSSNILALRLIHTARSNELARARGAVTYESFDRHFKAALKLVDKSEALFFRIRTKLGMYVP